jgi:hypothetical protein
MLDRVKFFRRRQFVLGPEPIGYEGWKKLKADDRCLISVHPDLPATMVEKGDARAVLLGYWVDPARPELGDEGILRRMFEGPLTTGGVANFLENLTGRFALIVKAPQGLWLFPDACALRQINYCLDPLGAVWCASQAETLAERFRFEYDPEVLSFRKIPAYQSGTDEFWLLNDRTAYREIKYLLPDHYLDLRQAVAVRFWPTPGAIGTLSIDENTKRCAEILQKGIRGAAERFDLKMGISAGSDSRRSLAAAKGVKDKIFFFTHRLPGISKADVEIPARLLPKLGIPHHLFEVEFMSPEFKEYYDSNATWAREKRGHEASTALKHLGSEATVLNSNISEVPQCFYWLPRSNITGEGLAMATGLNHPMAVSEFQKWIDGARSACEASRLNIMTLFDYELRSRWVSAAYAEYDIAYETFCPYNNRRLFAWELAVDERHRRSRRLDVLIKHIRYMWPEVLAEPINPEEKMAARLQKIFWNYFIHKTITPWVPIYDYLRYVKLKWRYRRLKQPSRS